MVTFNPNVSSSMPIGVGGADQQSIKTGNSGFEDAIKAVEKGISQVDNVQQATDVSIQDMLSGKGQDITSVVSEVAKADMSFKLLVGVRNKLIEAYKATMNMPI
ncbi:MAG: flagellar hook-basal body complex protein FliE [Planctomycetes bacterium GWF2_42_9]|nr:MAG: flagellar hook-basal body complex protein FliE [Planctomycetes bacterium GWF2_42_9]HAL44825.1 flagellar hook-basal body complex protein FliE [Phycisphaerales bacterium]